MHPIKRQLGFVYQYKRNEAAITRGCQGKSQTEPFLLKDADHSLLPLKRTTITNEITVLFSPGF
jgi:hypothetical protein